MTSCGKTNVPIFGGLKYIKKIKTIYYTSCINYTKSIVQLGDGIYIRGIGTNTLFAHRQ